MRAKLLAEAGRRPVPSAAPADGFGVLWSSLWPRFAWGAAAFAALAVVIGVWMHSPPPASPGPMAKLEPPPPPVAAPAVAPPAPAAPPPIVEMAKGPASMPTAAKRGPATDLKTAGEAYPIAKAKTEAVSATAPMKLAETKAAPPTGLGGALQVDKMAATTSPVRALKAAKDGAGVRTDAQYPYASTVQTAAAPSDANSNQAAAMTRTRFAQWNNQAGGNAGFANNALQTQAAPVGNLNQMRQTANNAPTTPVLNNFEMEQDGRQVRIIDSDGSVYVGQMQEVFATAPTDVVSSSFVATSNTANRNAVGRAEQQNQVRRYAQQNNQPSPVAFTFSVSGTNRTLNQPVVLTGNYELAGAAVALANQQQIVNPAPGAQSPSFAKAAASRAGQMNQAALQNVAPTQPAANNVQQSINVLPARIQGYALIGGTRQIEVIAIENQ